MNLQCMGLSAYQCILRDASAEPETILSPLRVRNGQNPPVMVTVGIAAGNSSEDAHNIETLALNVSEDKRRVGEYERR